MFSWQLCHQWNFKLFLLDQQFVDCENELGFLILVKIWKDSDEFWWMVKSTKKKKEKRVDINKKEEEICSHNHFLHEALCSIK